jgi:putative FmdB family regulatory protein
MPIYAYKCESCGHAKDVLQKISAEPLRDCPACGKPSFAKQLTAAGFQLKGSGWYATDFRGGSGAAAGDAPAGDAGAEQPASQPTSQPASTPEVASKPAAASAGACGASCACH